MVPTLVVSIFSMNLMLPMQSHPYAFWVVLGLALTALACVWGWWLAVTRRVRRHL
jgi:magnesium transporter